MFSTLSEADGGKKNYNVSRRRDLFSRQRTCELASGNLTTWRERERSPETLSEARPEFSREPSNLHRREDTGVPSCSRRLYAADSPPPSPSFLSASMAQLSVTLLAKGLSSDLTPGM